MASQFESVETTPITNVPLNDTTQPTPEANGHDKDNSKVDEEEEKCVISKKRIKTSIVWHDFNEVKNSKGETKVVCEYCKAFLSIGGRGGSTSHLKRHNEICLPRSCKWKKIRNNHAFHFPFPIQLTHFLIHVVGTPMKRWEIIATVVMVHELPFSIVEE